MGLLILKVGVQILQRAPNFWVSRELVYRADLKFAVIVGSTPTSPTKCIGGQPALVRSQ